MPARCSRAWCARGVVAPREGSRSAVDLCGLRPPHGVGAETGGIESEPSDPTMDESRILTGRDVLKSADPTFEQERRTAFTTGEQRLDRRECLLGDPELNRTTRLLLDDGGSIPHAVSGAHIIDAQANEIACSQLAVDAEIEQGEITGRARHFEPHPIRPDVHRYHWTLLTDEDAPLFQGRLMFVGWCSIVTMADPPIRRPPSAHDEHPSITGR